MSNNQRKTLVMQYDDLGVTEDVMRTMAPLSEFGVGLTDVIGQAADCLLSPRNKPVEAHVCEYVDVYYFDQSQDISGGDADVCINGREVPFEDFHEMLTDAVVSVYDHVEKITGPVLTNTQGGRVRSTYHHPGTSRVFLDIEFGDE